MHPPDSLRVKNHGMSEAHGLEIMTLCLKREPVEFASNTPRELTLKGFIGKQIHKKTTPGGRGTCEARRLD